MSSNPELWGKPIVFVVSWDRTSELFHNEVNGQWTAMPLGAPNQTLSAGGTTPSPPFVLFVVKRNRNWPWKEGCTGS